MTQHVPTQHLPRQHLPAPRTPEPRSAPSLRWGIAGPGWIAERFVTALHRHTDQQVVAVGSRSARRAREFAAHLGIPTAHHGYPALFDDPRVDVIYLSTPHPAHHRGALDAIAAGKHVMVEKPLALNAGQGREIAEAARAAGVFAGEAMWTRFLPKFDVIGQLLADGVLGEIRSVMADHGEYFDTGHRIHDWELAGGPLLDLGTYPFAFAGWVCGAVDSVAAIGLPASDRLNGQISAVVGHAGGAQSVVTTTILADTPTTAAIAGTDAYLHLPGPFYQPGPFTLTRRGAPTLVHNEPRITHADALHFCAVDAARDIASGATGSTVHPLDDAIATLAVMDAVRAQLGIVFPGETVPGASTSRAPVG